MTLVRLKEPTGQTGSHTWTEVASPFAQHSYSTPGINGTVAVTPS